MTRLVALDLPGGDLFVREVEAAWSRGDAVFPLDQRLSDDSKAELVGALGAHLVVDPAGVTNVSTGRSLETGDALVIATSGSTGRPKGVVHTHDSLRASSSASLSRLGATSDDHWLACLPLAHIGGFSVLCRALHASSRLTVLPNADPDAVMAASRSGCNRTALVPTLLHRIDVSAFETVLLGGSRPPAHRPTNVIATYGLSETGSGVVYDGTRLDTVELRIDDVGEVLVRGPMLMRSYRDGTTSIDADGWLHTKDSGSIDDAGILSIQGRLDDLIKTGGEKVWPERLERFLETRYTDRTVGVVGVPDDEWGEVVVLATDRVGLDLVDVRAQVKAELPAYYAPKFVVVCDLPRTSNGKIRRHDLRIEAERIVRSGD